MLTSQAQPLQRSARPGGRRADRRVVPASRAAQPRFRCAAAPSAPSTAAEPSAPPLAEPAPEAEDLIASKALLAELVDPSAFGTRGEQWVLAQLVAIALVLAPPAPLTGAVDSLAALGLFCGLGLVGYSLVSLGRSLSPLPAPRAKHELVTSGIYSYVRHPMYGGLLLSAAGLAVLTHSDARLVAVAGLWWILEQKVALEESALLELYPEYGEYRDKVKKFLPYIF